MTAPDPPHDGALRDLDLHGAVLHAVDLRGAVVRESDLRGLHVVGSVVDDVRIDPFAGRLGSLVVDGVEVSAYVAAELDRRYPERATVREARSVADLGAAWAEVERGWAATIDRVDGLSEEARQRRVGGEWSAVETLRHLCFAVDLWLATMLRGEIGAFDPRDLPMTETPEVDASLSAELGLDRDARPTWAEAVALHTTRRALVRGVLCDLTELADLDDLDDPGDPVLDQPRTGTPVPSWGEETRTVREIVRTVLREHVEHRRYLERDLGARDMD